MLKYSEYVRISSRQLFTKNDILVLLHSLSIGCANFMTDIEDREFTINRVTLLESYLGYECEKPAIIY